VWRLSLTLSSFVFLKAVVGIDGKNTPLSLLMGAEVIVMIGDLPVDLSSIEQDNPIELMWQRPYA